MSATETRFDALTPIFGDSDPGGLRASFKTAILSWLLFPV